MSESIPARTPWLGIIADDFTGATDVAGYLVREGTSTVQFFGVPDADVEIPEGVDCVVIALKSRSVAATTAVEQSPAANAWLQDRGVEHVYFKYCSTFDSTDAGNIGPVADALADALGEETVIVAPSAPENGRTVFEGKLFVWRQLLEESPLKDHPLNPMRDSDLVRLLSRQTARGVDLVDLRVVADGTGSLEAAVRELAGHAVRHVVIDAITNADLDVIARVALARRLSSGSAGLGAALGRARSRAGVDERPPAFPAGAAFVVSGSCSAMTRRQVEEYQRGHPSFLVDPERIDAGEDVVGEALRFVTANLERSPLVYSTTDPASVARAQRVLGIDRAAEIVEQALSAVTIGAVAAGARKIVVAGGETSGAVVSALRVPGIRIGREVSVGVPWSITLGDEPVALILKSGNFGGPDFFDEAVKIAEEVA